MFAWLLEINFTGSCIKVLADFTSYVHARRQSGLRALHHWPGVPHTLPGVPHTGLGVPHSLLVVPNNFDRQLCDKPQAA